MTNEAMTEIIHYSALTAMLSDSELHQNSKDIQKYLNGKTVILQ